MKDIETTLFEELKIFENEYGYYSKYLNDKSLEEEIEKILTNFNIKYSIDSNTLFDSPSYECGYISIAWIDENNNLGHTVFEWTV